MTGIDVPSILIGGIHIAVGVLVTVQGLKVFGVVDGDTAPKAALLSAFAFGALAALQTLVPATAPYVELGFITYVGAAAAGLGYEYLAKPVLEKIGLAVRSEDL